MPRLSYLLFAALALVACDGDEAVAVDSATGADGGGGDAVVDLCYREHADGTNGTDAEPTGLALGVGRVAICGAIDTGHPGGVFLDVDQYEIAVTTAGPVVVRLTSPSAGGLERVDLVVKNSTGRLAIGRVHGGLGVTVLLLGAGAHILAVESKGDAALAVPYQLEVVADDPMARCPIDGAPAPSYREPDERRDGHRANDVVTVRTSPAVLTNLTASTKDAPAPTQLAVSSGGRQIIAGLSADVTAVEDPYHDRDTFAFYTGQGTNLLEARAIWPGTVADLDLFVFEADHADDPMGRPVQLFTGELLVTAVKPSTLYWLWVGGSNRSNTLPAGYTLALCGHEVAIGAGLL